MSQRDVALALELVARALGSRMSNDPEESREVSMFTLEDVARELTEYAETLKAAPVQSCEPTTNVWGEHNGCVAHPFGGWDCVAEV